MYANRFGNATLNYTLDKDAVENLHIFSYYTHSVRFFHVKMTIVEVNRWKLPRDCLQRKNNGKILLKNTKKLQLNLTISLFEHYVQYQILWSHTICLFSVLIYEFFIYKIRLEKKSAFVSKPSYRNIKMGS